MRISPISWTVSTETDPRVGGRFLLEPFPGATPADKGSLEPLKEASLKHLTFKTVFLLAFCLGKHRSDIHVWLSKNIRHQSGCSKVSLYPSPSFLSKNQLAKEGPDSVVPVVIIIVVGLKSYPLFPYLRAGLLKKRGGKVSNLSVTGSSVTDI